MAEHTRKQPHFLKIDHIAIAVRDLEKAVGYFCDVLGFNLQKRREIRGASTGMVAAEIEHNGIKFVLCQGTEPASQVSRLVDVFGPGIAHIAFAVENVESTAGTLVERGMSFDTTVVSGPGLTQIFSSRDENSGFSFEFIARSSEEGFLQGNVQSMFDQLESNQKF